MKARKEHFSQAMHTYLMMGLSVVVTLVMCMGVLVYRKIVDQSQDNSDQRIAINYVVNKIRANDGISDFQTSTCHGEGCLLIRQEESWTYIYYYEGKLMESVQQPNTACEVLWGDSIVNCHGFSVKVDDMKIQFDYVNEKDETYHETVHVSQRRIANEAE